MKPRAHNSAEAEFVLIMMLKMPWSRAGTAGPMLVISHPEAVAICSGHSVSGEGKKRGGGGDEKHMEWSIVTDYLPGLIGKSLGVLGECFVSLR